MLINPVNEQKEAYEFLTKLFQHIVDHLKAGKKISEIYESALSFIKAEGKEDHLKHLPKVFGYGIGLNKKEE